MRRAFWAGGLLGLLLMVPHSASAQASFEIKPQIAAETVAAAFEQKARSRQLVTFPDTRWGPVKVLRGALPAKVNSAPQPPAEKAETAEIVTFSDSQANPVRVLRGESAVAATTPRKPWLADATNLQVVTFADPHDRPVSIVRGWAARNLDTDLFGPASAADLDRVAFAVDGAESSHGADLRMWRPELGGPQGPMQVSAAAATDVGGGDRFDTAGNRALGRAYLARMYRRYGNWPDAIAAYN